MTEQGGLFLIDHKNQTHPADNFIRDTNMKNMVQLESSLSHFLALKKKVRPGINKWDSKMVQVWIS